MAVNHPIRLQTTAKGCFADGRIWTYTVWLHDATWPGSISDCNLYDNGIDITWQGKEDDIFYPIIPSTLRLNLWVDSVQVQQYVDQLQLVQEDRFYISILKDGANVWWRGTILQDQTRVEDNRDCDRYTVQISANCGLASLKDLKQDVPYIYPYYNHMSYITQLLNASLDADLYTGTERFVGSSIEYYDESMPASDNGLITEPLVYIRTGREGLIFNTDDDGNQTLLSSYDAISQILRSYNARIFLYDGHFQIVQCKELGDTIRFNYYTRGYGAPAVPEMVPNANGAQDLNVSRLIRQDLDSPIEANEYSYYPEIQGILIEYKSRNSEPHLIFEHDGQPGTTYRSFYQVPQGYGTEWQFWAHLTATGSNNSQWSFITQLSITADVSGTIYYAQYSAGLVVWDTTISTIGFYGSGLTNPGVPNPSVPNTFTIPKLPGSAFIDISYTVTSLTNVTFNALYFYGYTDPRVNKYTYQIENLDSKSTVIQEVKSPLLNDGNVSLPPPSSVFDGTDWVNLGLWGELNSTISYTSSRTGAWVDLGGGNFTGSGFNAYDRVNILGLSVGVQYRIVFSISGDASTNFRLRPGGSTSANDVILSSVGGYDEIITPVSGGDVRFTIINTTGINTLTINNIKVLQVSGATTDIYPVFLARQMLELQDSPRAKYYGSFWDDISPISLFYYDSIKYLFTKASLNIGKGEWEMTLLEIEQVPINLLANTPPPVDGPIDPGPLYLVAPINPTDEPLTVNIEPNGGNTVLYPGVNYGTAPGEGVDAVLPRTIQEEDGWLMMSNTETTDPPAPQPSGTPYLLNDDRWTPVGGSNSSVISHGHKYTFAEGAWLQGVKVYVPFTGANYINNLYFADVTDPDNILYEAIYNLTVAPQEWVTVSAGNRVLKSGSTFYLYLETYNSSSSTDFTDGWNYSGTDNNSPPPVQGWNNTQQNNLVRFEYQSLGGDYTTQIQNLVPGSSITVSQNGAPENNISYLTTALPVDQGTYAEIPVSLVSSGGSIGIGVACDVTFSSPVPQPTTFIWDELFWANFPPPAGITVEPILQYGGVDQVIQNTTSFGVDIQIQDAIISSDWDFLSYTPGLNDDANVNILNQQLQRYHFNADPLPAPLNSTSLTIWVSDFTGFLTAGSYLLDFSLIVNQNRVNRRAFYELWVDGAAVISFSKESKDAMDEIPFAQNSLLLEFANSGEHLIELRAYVDNSQLTLTLLRYAYNIAFWQ